MSKDQEKEAKSIADEVMRKNVSTGISDNVAADVLKSLQGKGADITGAIVILVKDIDDEKFRTVTSMGCVSVGIARQIPSILAKEIRTFISKSRLIGGE